VLRSSVFRIICGSRLLTTPRVDLALHRVGTKRGDFEPEKFEDQYEDALKELLSKKQKGEKIERPKRACCIECGRGGRKSTGSVELIPNSTTTLSFAPTCSWLSSTRIMSLLTSAIDLLGCDDTMKFRFCIAISPVISPWTSSYR
jgi:hypothetical protein